MRKLFLILAALLLLPCFVSCGTSDPVSGTWRASSVITADGREISVYELTADLAGLSAEEPTVIYRFSGGVLELYLNGETLTGSYTVSHEKVFLSIEGSESVMIYDPENDTLTTQGTGIKTVFRREGER